MEINEKVAIVTGGIGGIGFATVQYLLKNGASYVAIVDLALPDHESVINSLKKLELEYDENKFGYYSCNVKNKQEFVECYEEVMSRKKYVDILINNAGIIDENDVDLIVDVNLKSVIIGTMIAIERMGKHKGHKGGVVVNIGSNLGLVNTPTMPIYNATKHAVVSFVRSMKEHNKTIGVRILCMCPGITKTNLIAVGLDELRKKIFDFIEDSHINKMLSFYVQRPENAAVAIIEMIQKAKDGDVWFAYNDRPAFAVGEETDLEKLRIPFLI